MLSLILKIFSIMGILLLGALGLAVLLVLLVLFFPVCYRVSGRKDTEEMTVNARAWWLFGLLRASFVYPEPGRVLVKVLPFTVFDSGREAGSGGEKSSAASGGRTGKEEGAGEKQREDAEAAEKQREDTEAAGGETEKAAGNVRKQDGATDSGQTSEDTTERGREQAATAGGGEASEDAGGKSREQAAIAGGGEASEDAGGKSREQAETTAGGEASGSEDLAGTGQEAPKSSFFEKIGKIKYTIRSIYDKIKDIWENISYYIDLLREEETRLLFSHVIFRLGKILKSIRPRRIRGQILFGTGSPDTTGYAYGVYGMLSPLLGSRLAVTPDFTGAVLEGELDIAGHITVFAILWNGLRVLLDRKLRRFIKKIKAGRKR